jgi:hypothetical protein
MGPTPKCHFVPRLPNGSLEIPKIGFPRLWRPITLCADLWLIWSFKKSCSPHRELSNYIWHVTCTQGNQGNFWLLVVKSQTANLTSGPSFGNNLWFKCLNGSCEPILDIYVPRCFQSYNELFNPMVFHPWNCSLKIWKSITTLTPNVGVHLEMWGFIPSHSPTLPRAWNVTPELPFWPTRLQARCLGHEPKTRVAT